ncbi:hypothetical protein NDU88_000462 [Pleurodeles waltl]|uniref:Uncharacterized protein n=1 Tax=Pleurodeles waltl TaxID=8319 RepID=A0AAV7UR42_PLEWA|nr:hypothetical protein NDU88_000462 [Pleurodeles waltl]
MSDGENPIDNWVAEQNSGPGASESAVRWWRYGKTAGTPAHRVPPGIPHEARQCWQASTQRVYKLGDKTRNLLYSVTTRDVSARGMPLILDQMGSVLEELQVIAHTFTFYYKDLYAQAPQPPEEQENPILVDIPLSSIPAMLV